MSFIALSTAQVLLLSALTAGAVLVLFFLKLRHRRVVVGSSLLWQRILDHRGLDFDLGETETMDLARHCPGDRASNRNCPRTTVFCRSI